MPAPGQARKPVLPPLPPGPLLLLLQGPLLLPQLPAAVLYCARTAAADYYPSRVVQVVGPAGLRRGCLLPPASGGEVLLLAAGAPARVLMCKTQSWLANGGTEGRQGRGGERGRGARQEGGATKVLN